MVNFPESLQPELPDSAGRVVTVFEPQGPLIPRSVHLSADEVGDLRDLFDAIIEDEHTERAYCETEEDHKTLSVRVLMARKMLEVLS